MAFLLVVLLGLFWAPWHASSRVAKNPDSAQFPPRLWMSSTQLVELRGYPVETHEVRTADGYLLTIHRIPASRSYANESKAHHTPVLIGHGLGSNDEQWLVRETNIAFSLADNGFDVWLVNYRGSFYSRRHATLSVKSHEFWDFRYASWHESGVSDTVAATDYILAATQRPALIMVGHSMSSTVQAVFLAERPEYNDKVLASLFMAPPVYFRYPAGVMEVFRALATTWPNVKDAFSRLVINSPMPFPDMFRACHPKGEGGRPAGLCMFTIYFAGGHPTDTMETEDTALFKQMLRHVRTSASIRQIMHYFQGITSGEFRQYDYGPKKNKEIYGTYLPPPYNLSNIRAPCIVYYSSTDNCVSPQDAEGFARDLPSLKLLRKIDKKNFNHFDFLLASTVNDDVFKHVIDDLNKYV